MRWLPDQRPESDFAIARSLVSEGARVYVNGRTQERVNAAMQAIRAHSTEGKVDGIAADFSSAAGAESVIAKLPVVDVLVNNVGIFEPKPFAEIPDADWYRFYKRRSNNRPRSAA